MKQTHHLEIRSLKHRFEGVVLSACIQEQNNFSKIQKFLLRTDFGTNNKVVFDALQYLYENSKPIDLISVSKQMLSEIKATKYSENESYVKINQYLIKLTNLISNTRNLEYYALQLAQLSIHFQLLEQLHLLLHNKSLPLELFEDLDDFRKYLLPCDCNPLDLLEKAVNFFNGKYPNQSEFYQPILTIAQEFELRCFDVRKDFTIEITNSTNQFFGNFTPNSVVTEHWPETPYNLTLTEPPF